jgi:flagellum-specific ATP synthase
MIPKLLERAGTNDRGTITAFYTVLVDGDDMNEPITDKVRGTLDGHIVLNRSLAQAYHYPAIDVLASISRLSRRVTGEQTRKACSVLRELMSVYQSNEVMITTGIYKQGSSEKIDAAIEKHEPIEEFLKQEETDNCTMQDTLDRLAVLSGIEIPAGEYAERPDTEIAGAAEQLAAQKSNGTVPQQMNGTNTL